MQLAKTFTRLSLALIIFAGIWKAAGLNTLSENLSCEVQFFEAHTVRPADYKKTNDTWMKSEAMHKIFIRAPLASYVYFQPVSQQTWHLTMLSTQRHEFKFLPRYEITYLAARLTNLGQTLYRFEHKIGSRKSIEFSLDQNEPEGIFIQHAVTHDDFLHLTCSPE